MYYRQIGNHVSRIVKHQIQPCSMCTFGVTSFTPLKYLKILPGMKTSLFFKKKFSMGFCADLHPVNRIISKKRLKSGNPIILASLFYCNILFKQAAE